VRRAAALILLSLGGGCASVEPPTGAVQPSAACTDSVRSKAAAFVTDIMDREARGERLDELLGRGGSHAFYDRIAYDASEEPGWDVIYVYPEFRIVGTQCTADPATDRPNVAVTVSFAPGQWFDREHFGAAEAREVRYDVGMDGPWLLVTSRLPAPFLRPDAAISVLGKPPYDGASARELRQHLMLQR
jgi:hypothetical protein